MSYGKQKIAEWTSALYIPIIIIVWLEMMIFIDITHIILQVRSGDSYNLEVHKKGFENISQTLFWIGGAKGDRTPDLLNAIQALSQLSYNPVVKFNNRSIAYSSALGV